MRIDSGSITVGGTTVVSNNANNRLSIMQVSGGTFTSNDTSGAGIQIGGSVADGNPELAELLVTGGTLNTNTITLGDANQTTGTDYFIPVGGTTYVGSGGIVAGGATGTATVQVDIGNASFASAPTIAANGNWSSSVPMAFNKSSTGLSPTIQAANSSGGAENITLSGLISGTGGLNKTGGGYLALTGSTSYKGATTVSAGLLVDQANTILTNSSALNINGSMIIQNSPNLQNITQEVAGGYNGGAWNGSTSTSGIPITSSAAASDASHLHGLGAIINDTSGTGANGNPLYGLAVSTGSGPVNGSLGTSFEGYGALNNSDVLIKYTYYGDTTLKGYVNGSDYSRIDNAYVADQAALASSSTIPDIGWYNGDFNYDGMVDGSDYTLMDNAFNSQSGIIQAQIASPEAVATDQISGGATGTSAVPEPTTLGLLGIGALGLLGRRSNQRRR